MRIATDDRSFFWTVIKWVFIDYWGQPSQNNLPLKLRCYILTETCWLSNMAKTIIMSTSITLHYAYFSIFFINGFTIGLALTASTILFLRSSGMSRLITLKLWSGSTILLNLLLWTWTGWLQSIMLSFFKNDRVLLSTATYRSKGVFICLFVIPDLVSNLRRNDTK